MIMFLLNIMGKVITQWPLVEGLSVTFKHRIACKEEDASVRSDSHLAILRCSMFLCVFRRLKCFFFVFC